MKRTLLGVLTSCVVVSTAAAGGFSYTAPGGAIVDDQTSVFPLFMDPPPFTIDSLILDINGLTHTNPEDLDIYLLHASDIIHVLNDQGGMIDISGVKLTFEDSAGSVAGTPMTSGTYKPLGLSILEDDGLATFVGQQSGPQFWYLIISDDDLTRVGSFESFTLRGVPEPATLCLLALGAMATLARKRR